MTRIIFILLSVLNMVGFCLLTDRPRTDVMVAVAIWMLLIYLVLEKEE